MRAVSWQQDAASMQQHNAMLQLPMQQDAAQMQQHDAKYCSCQHIGTLRKQKRAVMLEPRAGRRGGDDSGGVT